MDPEIRHPAAEAPRPRIYTLPLDRRGEPQPEVFRTRIDGVAYRLRLWTAAEWAATPEEKRPALVLVGDRGGRVAIEAE